MLFTTQKILPMAMRARVMHAKCKWIGQFGLTVRHQGYSPSERRSYRAPVGICHFKGTPLYSNQGSSIPGGRKPCKLGTRIYQKKIKLLFQSTAKKVKRERERERERGRERERKYQMSQTNFPNRDLPWTAGALASRLVVDIPTLAPKSDINRRRHQDEQKKS